MIANITQGSYLKPLLDYNLNKVNKEEATILTIGNTFKNDIKLASSIITHTGNNSKRKDRFFHVSLNFAKEDLAILNDDMLKNIAKEYLIEAGFPEDHTYIAFKHNDTIHPHIHIVTSKILSNGKCNTLSNEYKNSQKITRRLEEKYNLTRVNSQKNSNEETIRLYAKFKEKPHSLRHTLNYHIAFALKKYKADSMEKFKEYLKNNNIDLNILEGKNENGKEYKGIVYNKVTTDFKQNQKGIKASSLHSKPTLEKLEKAFSYNKTFHKSKKNTIKKIIENIFFKYEQINIAELKRILEDKNIELNYKQDSTGRLVGISFKDIETQYIYTGENIGKNFTAKNWIPKIGNQTQLNPKYLTMSQFNIYKQSILKPNSTVQEIKNLLSHGFNVKIVNNGLYINNYKNNTHEGFVLFRENISSSIDNNTIELLSKSLKHDFDNLSKESIDSFNKERNPETEQNKIETNFTDNTKSIFDYSEDSFTHQESDVDENYQISDIDKKKKKPFKRRFQ